MKDLSGIAQNVFKTALTIGATALPCYGTQTNTQGNPNNKRDLAIYNDSNEIWYGVWLSPNADAPTIDPLDSATYEFQVPIWDGTGDPYQANGIGPNLVPWIVSAGGAAKAGRLLEFG